MLLLKLKIQKKSIKSVLLPIAFSIGLLSGVAHAGMKEGVAAFMAGNGGLVVKELAPLDHDGNPIVHGLLSRVYWTGLTGVPKDRSLAAAYAKRALPGLIKEADGGSGLAQSTLSILYREGNGVEKDCIKAVDWAKRSADQNDPTGLMAFGALYAVGSCQPKDDEKAAMWSRKAAESGHGGAQSNIGWNYENGRGVAKDEQQALYWFIKAAEQGVANAQLALGLRHATGRGVQKDDQLAVQWYQKAADQGLAQAQLNLGFMIENGRGVVKDEQVAAQWYQKAADQGDAWAQRNLGLMFSNGRGVVKDEQLAVQWFKKSAEQGNVGGQNNLGVMYAQGKGVPRNFEMAYFWWLLASAKGDEFAKKSRDQIERELSAAQRAQVQAEASNWKPNSGIQPRVAKLDETPKQTRPTPEPTPNNKNAGSTGTGWAVTRTQLVTNAHVIEGCKRIEAKGLGSIKIQAVDAKSDLALLSVNNNPVVATLRSSRLRQGDAVTVVGYPLAGMLASGANVTAGHVSALAGMQNDTRNIQITAPVQPGNSGGPLLDASGHVVGVVVSKLNALKVAKVTGDIPQNVNFAVSLFTLQGFLEANGVDYATAPSTKNMATADVAEIGKRFTVLLECYE